MVLQTYYHNLDNTYNKLQTINEYMDDIEAGRCPWLGPCQPPGLLAITTTCRQLPAQHIG